MCDTVIVNCGTSLADTVTVMCGTTVCVIQ